MYAGAASFSTTALSDGRSPPSWRLGKGCLFWQALRPPQPRAIAVIKGSLLMVVSLVKESSVDNGLGNVAGLEGQWAKTERLPFHISFELRLIFLHLFSIIISMTTSLLLALPPAFVETERGQLDIEKQSLGIFSPFFYSFLLGLFFVLPCIENYQKVDLRTITLDVPPQEVTVFQSAVLTQLPLLLC